MNKKQAQQITKCLLGESKYGVKGLAYLDEFVPEDSPHYENAQKLSEWFKENGSKKGKTTPKWVILALGKLQEDAFLDAE